MSTKSCQSCLTLCNPMGSSDHGILQVRILEWVAMPSSKDLHDTGIKPTSPVLLDWQVNSLPLSHQGKASFQASGSFPMSWLFTLGSQSTGAPASASGLPLNIQGWFSLGLIDLLVFQGILKSLLEDHSSKASVLQCSVFFMLQLSSLYTTNGKTILLTIWTFVSKVMSLLCNGVSRFFRQIWPWSTE